LTSNSDIFAARISDAEIKPNYFELGAVPVQPTPVVEPELPTHLFTWKYGGTNVLLAGTFSDWKQMPMRKVADRVFELLVTFDKTGPHQYKFIVDNQWLCAED
jgi:1,4-alpha-glucan branching enzyme